MKILWRRRSKRRVGGWAVTEVKQRKGWRIRCDVGKATEGLENELWRRWSDKAWRMSTSPTSQIILKPFFRFSYVTESSLTSPGEPPMVWYIKVTRSPMGPKVSALNQAQTGGCLSYKNPGFIKDILKYSQNWCYTSLKSRYDPIVKTILLNWI